GRCRSRPGRRPSRAASGSSATLSTAYPAPRWFRRRDRSKRPAGTVRGRAIGTVARRRLEQSHDVGVLRAEFVVGTVETNDEIPAHGCPARRVIVTCSEKDRSTLPNESSVVILTLHA